MSAGGLCGFPGPCTNPARRFFVGAGPADPNPGRVRLTAWKRCRRHCYERWDPDEVPLEEYLAFEVLSS